MGIRVNKRLGYGLVDVAYGDRDDDMLDPRINKDSPLLDWSTRKDATFASYVEFLKADPEKPSERYFIEKLAKDTDPYDCVFLGNVDYGLEHVLCVTPVWLHHDWHRTDDTIDWVTESYLFDSNPEDRVDVFPHGIFPFSGTYMDARTGELIKGWAIMDWIRLWTNLKEKDKALLRGSEDLDLFADSFGMTHAEAERYVVPNVPEEVRNLCRFGELFTDETTVLELRPMMCTYWC